MATAKAAKKDKALDAAAQLQALVSTPTLDLTPTKKVAKSSTFSGTLTAFGLMTIPVKTYKATDADSIGFNQVHKCVDKDGKETGEVSQLKQGKMSCEKCSSAVDRENVLKGFKVGDKFITVTQAEIDAQKPTGDKNMILTEFIDGHEIDPIFYESTEFIAPDKGGEKPFALLIAGMKATNKVAKGTRVKGGREQTFVVRPYGQNGAAVSYLFADYEVREFDKAVPVEVKGNELELATTLIERYEAAFTPATEDRFLANVRRMLEAKAAGKEPAKVEVKADPAATVDLLSALQASLAAAPKSKKTAAK